MPKGKKGPKKNGYSLFADEKSKEMGISMQEAFGHCAGMWEELPEYEKQRYKDRAKEMNSSRSGGGSSVRGASGGGVKLGFFYTSAERAQIVQEVEAEEADQDELNARMVGWINRFVEPRDRDEPIQTESVFIVGHVNVSCTPRDKNDPIVSVELAFAKFSLKEGIIDTWHSLLNLQDLPKIYTFTAIQTAQKTHKIPPNKIGETDIVKVRVELIDFLRNDPVFAMDTVKEVQVEAMCRVLRECLDLPNEVYQLGELAYTMDNTLFDTKPETFTTDPWKHQVGFRLESPAGAERYIEDDPFLYKTRAREGCDFHWALEDSDHCSLSIVRRRVYAIWAKPGRRVFMPVAATNEGVVEGRTVPWVHEKRPDPIEDPWVADFRQIACVKEYVNQFGQQVTRAGPMGGQVSVNPDMDADETIRQLSRSRHDDSIFRGIDGLQIDEGSDANGPPSRPPVATGYGRTLFKPFGRRPDGEDDDDETASYTTTVTATSKDGAAAGGAEGSTTNTDWTVSGMSDLPSSAVSSEAGGVARPGMIGFLQARNPPSQRPQLRRPTLAGKAESKDGGTGSAVSSVPSSSAKRKNRLAANFGDFNSNNEKAYR